MHIDASDRHSPSAARVPRATYRFQFHRGFTLCDATDLIPYLDKLGISHVYASPLLKAQPGSAHGYDICDPGELNPEIGTETELRAFVDALRRHEMGLIVDIVPNHMGISGPENRWWWDVLAHGPRSEFAGYFDIDWQAPDPRTRGKVLLPVLGDRYGAILERGELKVERRGDEFRLRYYEREFPISGRAGDLVELADKNDCGMPEERPDQLRCWCDKLDAVIRNQCYRLTYWRHGDSELNYRRFFNITSLAAVRVEKEEVFEAMHRRIFEWWSRGWIDGVRIDHPDGLRDPEQYLRRLRDRMPDAWIVVEKILGADESLRREWAVAGTSGYDFVNRAGRLFVDNRSEKALTEFYAEFTGEPIQFERIVREKKGLVLSTLFIAEIEQLVRFLLQVAEADWRFRDLTRQEIRTAVCEVAKCFPVYRSFIRAESGEVGSEDRENVQSALKAARAERDEIPPAAFDLIESVLLMSVTGPAAAEFVMRLQQLTGATMAKGLEDTAFYCFNRFVALNEVGGDPGRFGTSLEAFHAACSVTQRDWADSMLASSTHDTKRSEDVRARLFVLSEIPDEWSEAVRRWSKLNERHRRISDPDRNAEYLFYQTIVGAWPISVERVVSYMEKAAREAKQHTTWTDPDANYEEAIREFVRAALTDAEFVKCVKEFVASIDEAGQVNSLGQTLLKLTTPGVPDLYQGCELWDFSLVDPDNRRPVDFELRRTWLDELRGLSPEMIWKRRDSGIPKLWVIQQALGLRRRHQSWFDRRSSYTPLYARGAKREHVVAFIRNGSCVSVAPRWWLRLGRDWADTALELPEGNWLNEFTGETWAGGCVLIEQMLRRFPVALLSRKE